MAYATVAELKAQINKTGTEDDVALAAFLDAATTAIDQFCHRPDGFVADAVASARVYSGTGSPVLHIDECTSITLVAVKDSPTDTTYTSWATTDWVAFSGDPTNPDFQPTAKGKPYTAIMCTAYGDYSSFTNGSFVSLKGFANVDPTRRHVPTIQVTAKWGYAVTVPATIKQACLITVARWYKRGQTAYADAIAMPDMGQTMFRQVLDPDVKMILQSGRYIRPAIG